MDMSISTKRSHKEWRRLAKKERRRRLRRKAAVERDADKERLRAALENSAGYLNWIQEQEDEEKRKDVREHEEHAEQERLWLENEITAQKEWQILQERKLKAKQQQLEQDAKIREEFETKQKAIRKKQEEEKRKHDENVKKHEELLQEIDDYIDNGIKTPEPLREIIDSQPGKELCPFFTKTGACRYGDTCSRNHRRVCLSKVILVPGFYSHFSLEKNSAEYDTDIGLEFESSETRQHFREFYKDVVPELESFGRIKTLKYCCNTEIHLRGNLYVEYYTEREAARALRKLKGRWYAGRQLNCEFANLKSWRGAVCGMTKCPKGRACNFLHTFKNPHDEYDIKSPPRWAKQSATSHEATSSRRSSHRNKSKWEEAGHSDAEEDRNWRWSESPEVEVENRLRNSEKRRRSDHQKSNRDKRHDQSHRDKITDNAELSLKRRRSHSKKSAKDKIKNDDSLANGRDSSRARASKSRRTREEERDDSKSSRRSRKNYLGSNNDGNHRSKTQRYSSRSRKQTEERDKERHGSKNYDNHSDEDSSRRNPAKSSDKSHEKKSNSRSKLTHVKSKWDKEVSDQSSSENTESSDSDSSGTTETTREEVKKLRKTCTKRSDDEWATTDSENEDAPKEKRRNPL